MARNPLRINPQASARAAAQRVRDAMNAAKTRTGGEGRLVVLCAGGLFSAFVLLAAFAPILMNAPPFIANLIGFVLFGLVFASTIIGGVALWRIIKAGAMDGDVVKAPTVSIFSQAAIESALSDAEDAGLRQIAPRIVQEAMTGRVQGRPVAVMRAQDATFAVIRLKEPAAASLLVAPGKAPWPFAFPNDGALTPLLVPLGIDAMAWTTQRDVGLELCKQIGPVLAMSAAGGEVPFVSLRGRALVMKWTKGDVGTASVIAYEAAKVLS